MIHVAVLVRACALDAVFFGCKKKQNDVQQYHLPSSTPTMSYEYDSSRKPLVSSLKNFNAEISSERKSLSVTMINNHPLPDYSPERFYLLSEIEAGAHSTLFLADFASCDETDETVATTSEASLVEEDPVPLSNALILYLLWGPDRRATNPETITEEIREKVNLVLSWSHQQQQRRLQAQKALRKRKEEAEEKGDQEQDTEQTIEGKLPSNNEDDDDEFTEPAIYLVVDALTTDVAFQDDSEKSRDDDDDDKKKQKSYRDRVRWVDECTRCVVKDPDLRLQLEGMTVGISNHARAAPGLEACVNAVVYGARDRRKRKGKNRWGTRRSAIGVVCPKSCDLLGPQGEFQETDAAQGVLQSRTCAEWSGNGNLQTFARRAHVEWCKQHNVRIEQPKPSSMRRFSRANNASSRRNVPMDAFRLILADPVTMVMLMIIVAWTYLQLSTTLSDPIQKLIKTVEDLLQEKTTAHEL